MLNHPAIDLVCERISKDLIGGAADTAKEVMSAIAQVVEDSKAASLEALYGEMDAACLAILKVCPSFAPPINVLHMMMGTIESDLESLTSLEEAKKHLKETEKSFNTFMETAFEKIATIGAELIKEGDKVFMFSMTSSVWKVLRKAKAQGKKFAVLVTEARPGNEGLWTVDEMYKSGIPVEVSIDACLGELIAQSNIAFAGVDSVAADGSVFNKAGTFLSALVAREYGVPFYFVTDTLKFDTATLLGLPFRSELVHYNEIFVEKKYDTGVTVVGSLFDVTPPRLITAIITELGPIPPSSCINVMWNMRRSKRISELLPDWAHNKL
jgi:translation initiation factor 2B subunit (eIF-2B alpha/beta/delta family)